MGLFRKLNSFVKKNQMLVALLVIGAAVLFVNSGGCGFSMEGMTR